jgi:hypothetical protein
VRLQAALPALHLSAPHMVPDLSETPPRPAFTSLNSSECLTSTPSSGTRRHRLLYRGALALPDSWITLDGLTFISSTVGAGINSLELLQSPLALALESMRGRPTIHLVGMVKLKELKGVWLDETGDVSL